MIDTPEIDQLVWDDWNSKHIAKHRVTRDEIAEVIAGETVTQETYKQRFLVLGETLSGRLLAVVIGPDPIRAGAYYTFSARPASRQERRLFQQLRGGEEL